MHEVDHSDCASGRGSIRQVHGVNDSDCASGRGSIRQGLYRPLAGAPLEQCR